MQNRATINMYVRLCVHNTGNALVGPSMCSFMRTNETDTPRSAQQFVKMFHFEEFDVFDG